MQLNSLKRNTKNKRSIAVGRGGKRGKTSGKGTKGQNARAGRKKRPEMRDIIKRFPKLRGRGVSPFKSIVGKNVPVNLSVLEANFSSGDKVSPNILVAKRIVKTVSGKIPFVKILGTGSLTKKLSIRGCTVSSSARDTILKVGGSVR